MKYKSEIITILAGTDGKSTSGQMTITSDAFTNAVQYIRLDKHVKYKIWARRVSGSPATIKIEYAKDYSDWTSPLVLDVIHLASEGELDLEKRKPIIIVGRTGKEAIRFTWEQVNAGLTYLSAEIEIEPM